jgi:hypothetical protein
MYCAFEQTLKILFQAIYNFETVKLKLQSSSIRRILSTALRARELRPKVFHPIKIGETYSPIGWHRASA